MNMEEKSGLYLCKSFTSVLKTNHQSGSRNKPGSWRRNTLQAIQDMSKVKMPSLVAKSLLNG